jgi:hypothetical protein
VLAYKQYLVYARNLRATLMRLLAPLFFMFLLWLLDLAVRADNVNISTFTNNPDPAVAPVGPIPACETDTYGRTPCWDFIYSPNNSAAVDVSRAAALSARLVSRRCPVAGCPLPARGVRWARCLPPCMPLDALSSPPQ